MAEPSSSWLARHPGTWYLNSMGNSMQMKDLGLDDMSGFLTDLMA